MFEFNFLEILCTRKKINYIILVTIHDKSDYKLRAKFVDYPFGHTHAEFSLNIARNTCKVKKCTNRRGTAGIYFFSFPIKDPER